MIPTREFVELDKLIHDRASFDCGQEELNTFLISSAARHKDAGISRTMVLPEANVLSPAGICAYYTLSHTEIKRDTLPTSLAKKLPRYPLPVILIAQLTVHRALQGRGLGKTTLICALEHVLEINDHLPSYAVVIDAIDERIQSFYEQYGFKNLYSHQQRTRLFISMNTVKQLFE